MSQKVFKCQNDSHAGEGLSQDGGLETKTVWKSWVRRGCGGNFTERTRVSSFTFHKFPEAVDRTSERVRNFRPLFPEKNPVVHCSELNCLFLVLWSLVGVE